MHFTFQLGKQNNMNAKSFVNEWVTIYKIEALLFKCPKLGNSGRSPNLESQGSIMWLPNYLSLYTYSK